jgi:hypothetical protein
MLNQAPRHEDVLAGGGIVPCILKTHQNLMWIGCTKTDLLLNFDWETSWKTSINNIAEPRKSE